METLEVSYVYLHPTSLGHGEIVLFGADHVSTIFIPASISDLERDLQKQARLIELGFHPHGKLIPWKSKAVIAVKEGFYKWNEEKQTYSLCATPPAKL